MPSFLSSLRMEVVGFLARPATPALPGQGIGNAGGFAADVLPAFDLGCLALAAWFSATLYEQFTVSPLPAPIEMGLAGWLTLLAPFILYDKRFGCRPLRLGEHAARFTGFAALGLVLAFIAQSLQSTPAGYLATFFALGFLSTSLSRTLIARYLLHLQQHRPMAEAVAIVGAGPLADRLAHELRRMQRHTTRLVGIFDDDPRAAGSGTVDQLIELGRSRRIDWIVLALAPGAALNAIMRRLTVLGVPIALCPPHLGVPFDRPIGHLGGAIPVTVLADKPLKNWDAVAKRAEDLVVGILLLVALAPLLALIALAIKLDSPGPVLFRQRRHALNNSTFDILKFRTMRWEPAGTELKQTRRNDDRVTTLGRFLRASSLDELPQLFNVLKGEMSLVGPRPHAVNMRTEDRLGTEITALYPHRHRVKPGITGWSQVNGSRGATHTTAELRRRVELDLHYIENWSLLLDFRILALTIFTVIRADNAY